MYGKQLSLVVVDQSEKLATDSADDCLFRPTTVPILVESRAALSRSKRIAAQQLSSSWARFVQTVVTLVLRLLSRREVDILGYR